MKRILAGALLFVLALAAPAFALQPGQTTFFTGNGDEVFPFQQLQCSATGATPQTCNGGFGQVTTNTLTTALSTTASYVINNSFVAVGQRIQCTLTNYSGTPSTNGDPVIEGCFAGAGTITVWFRNVNATNALNGTLTISFQIN